MTIRRYRLGLVALLVSACTTPQERAISAFCEREALRELPVDTIIVPVTRPIYVGERVVGARRVCKTRERQVAKDDKGRSEKLTETVCTDEPVTKPIYKDVLVQEPMDRNQGPRASYIALCRRQATQQGMFADVKAR
ncbi:MAG: hypothetical protein ACO3C0_10430 [Burkholderiaceae bacterium]|jgi:hypothetical protein